MPGSVGRLVLGEVWRGSDVGSKSGLDETFEEFAEGNKVRNGAEAGWKARVKRWLF